MNDTPTPETDAALYPMNGVDIVWPEFARELERERDEARHEIEGWSNKWNIAVEMAARAEVERDGNKYELDEEMKWHHRTHEELVQTQCKLLDMERERNEAQDMVEKFAEQGLELLDSNRTLKRERDEARELVQQMSESNQVILADLRHYREEWKKLKEGEK
jgi:hypothetical protein